MRRAIWILLLVGCTPRHRSAEERGRAVYESPKASNAVSNPFSCATCHEKGPGGSLAGATKRRSFWGGQRRELLASINDCRKAFMDARTPWNADDGDARDLYAYLASTSGPAEIPFTTEMKTLPVAKATDGEVVYVRACKGCHGDVHDGKGRVATFVPILPEEPKRSHGALSPGELTTAMHRRVREGAFSEKSGSMPPFSREVLSDADLAAVFAYLSL